MLVRVEKTAAHHLESAKKDEMVQPTLGILVWFRDKEDWAVQCARIRGSPAARFARETWNNKEVT